MENDPGRGVNAHPRWMVPGGLRHSGAVDGDTEHVTGVHNAQRFARGGHRR
jgi:hypothetical protein